MAKPLVVTLEAQTYGFVLSELERSDLYGSRKRIALDDQGRTCTRAALTVEAGLLVASGMSGQGYFNAQGHGIPRANLVGIDAKGEIVQTQASTLGVPQELHGPVDPGDVLNLELLGVYQLEPEHEAGVLIDRLKSGDIFSCRFNYAASLEVEKAYLLANDQGFFALVGKPITVDWVEEGMQFAPPLEAAQTPEDLDFEML